MVEGSRVTTRDRILKYYADSPDYLNGPFAGACHFGYTPKDEPFDLPTSLRSMEMLLGETLALPKGSHVVDAGCGFGRVATTIARHFYLHVTGVDLIQNRVEEAQRYAKDNNVSDKVEIIRGSYDDLPLSDASVSGVYTVETLVHADPLDKALSEFWRVLKPGGRLVLLEYSVPDRKSLDPIARRVTDEMIYRTGMESVGTFVHGGFPILLEDSGFEKTTVDDISKHVWPTWKWLFKLGLQRHASTLMGKPITDKTNAAAALLIWPYRHRVKYNLVTARKPKR